MMPCTPILAAAVLGALVCGTAADAKEVTIDDGKGLCHPWPEYLAEHQGERVLITLYDQYGEKIKLVARQTGDWKLFLMAGAEESRVGCEFNGGTRIEDGR